MSTKFYKFKKAKKQFICALCEAPRSLRYSKNLSKNNYIQILLIATFLSVLLVDVMAEKVLILYPLIWTIFEFTNKILYRKDVKCPYCGFDATWYRRDVKLARKVVQDFWNKKNSGSNQIAEDLQNNEASHH